MSSQWIIDDRFVLVRPLSDGDAELVHLATDRDDHDRPVVVKRFGVAEGAWTNEAWRVRATLEHPHLAKVVDFGRVQRIERRPTGAERGTSGPELDELYFVTRFHGSTHLGDALPDVLEELGPVGAPAWLASVVAQVASALAHMHERGMAHFDVKPEHIRIGGTLEQPMATLIDLGSSDLIARPLGNRVRGTLPFMAPEMLEDSEVDVRIDLFGLGATIYHSATKHVVLERESSDSNRDDWPALDDLAPALGSRWMEWVARLAAPDRSRRPESMRSFLDELLAEFPESRPSLGAMQPLCGHQLGIQERELEYLARELERIQQRDSDRSLAFVSGSEGSGRSSFLDRVRERAKLTGFTAVRVDVDAKRGSTWESITRTLTAVRRLKSPESRIANEIDAMVRWLSRGERPVGSASEALHIPGNETQRLRFRIAALMARAARDGVLVALHGFDSLPDDVADAWSAIARTASRDPEARLFIVATIDDPPKRSAVQRLATESCATSTRLRPATLHAARDLLRRTLGHGSLPLEVVARLHDETRGKAWRLIERCEAALRFGTLQEADGVWTWSDGESVAAAPAEPHEFETILFPLLDLVGGTLDFETSVRALESLTPTKSTTESIELMIRGSRVVRHTSGSNITRLEPSAKTPRVSDGLATWWLDELLRRRCEEAACVVARDLGSSRWRTYLESALARLRRTAAFNTSLELLDTIEQSGPLDAELVLVRVETSRIVGKLRDALDAVNELIGTLDSDALRGRVLFEKARLEFELEQPLEALSTLERLSESVESVDRSEVFALRCRAVLASSSHHEALRELESLEDWIESQDHPSASVLALSARLRAEYELSRGRSVAASESYDEAIRHATGSEQAQVVLDAARHAFARGDYESAAARGHLALQGGEVSEDPVLTSSAEMLLGRLAMNRGDAAEAAQRFKSCLRCMEILGHSTGVASTLNNLGLVYKLEDDHSSAEECFRRSMEISELEGSDELLVPALNNLSDVLVLRGANREALEHARRGLDLRKEKNDERGIAHSYYRLATIHRSRGELDAATDLAEESLEIRRALEVRYDLGYSLKLVGQLYFARGRYDLALRSLRQSLAHFEALGNRAGRANVLVDLALFFAVCGDLQTARSYAEQALELSRKERMELTVADAEGTLATIERLSGNLSASEHLLERSTETIRARGHRRRLTELLLQRSLLHENLGQFERSEAVLAEAYSAIDEYEFSDLRPTYYRVRGRLLAERDPVLASTFLERGIEEARRLDLPDETWRLLAELSRIAEAQGDAELTRSHRRAALDILGQLQARLPHELREAFRAQPDRARLNVEEEGSETIERSTIDRQPRVEASHELTEPPGDHSSGIAQEFLRLQEIAVLLSTERDIQALLEAILDAVLELFGAERAFLIRLDSDSDSGSHSNGFEIAAARNVDHESVDDAAFKVSRSIALEVARTGAMFLTDDARSDKRLRDSASVHDLRLQAIACFPLEAMRKRLGVIYIENRFKKRLITPDRIPILEAFSAHAAVALANASLHTENEERRIELEKSRQRIELLNRRLEERVQSQSRELEIAREELERQRTELGERFSWRNLVGDCDAMRTLFRTISRVEKTDLPILLEGESGTGKELVARAIHFGSKDRRDGAFISENCGAVAESLFEAELFGHARGAFTGAETNREGLFAAAEGGTLFLDEIHTLSLGMQAKLLRVLEEGEYRPVGESAFRTANVRLLSACNEPLDSLVRAGRFREDLFYRLNVIRIQLPPLRDRGGDILLLAEHFLERYASQHDQELKRLTSAAKRWLVQYPFPGNVRELRNRIERAAVLSLGAEIDVTDLEEETDRLGPRSPLKNPAAGSSLFEGSLREARDRFQVAYLEQLLAANQGIVAQAAREAGMTRESLHRLVKKLGLESALSRARSEE